VSFLPRLWLEQPALSQRHTAVASLFKNSRWQVSYFIRDGLHERSIPVKPGRKRERLGVRVVVERQQNYRRLSACVRYAHGPEIRRLMNPSLTPVSSGRPSWMEHTVLHGRER
jgi:hypothetical protein